jgi:hypothetical protein
MNYIVDARDIAAVIVNCTKPYIDHTQGEAMGEVEALDLAFLLIDDLLNDHLRWSQRTYGFETAMEKRFEWLQFTGRDKLSTHFLDKAYDRITTVAQAVFENVLDNRTWLVWSLRRISPDTAVLIPGEDFRIVDWTCRMKSGLWTMQDVASPIVDESGLKDCEERRNA